MMSNGGNHKKGLKIFSIKKEILSMLSQLGEDIIAYYNGIIKQESQRLEKISVGMRYYLEKFHEIYSGTTPSAQVQLVLQKLKEYNSIKESSQIIFKQVGYIKDVVKSQEIGFPQIKYYLTQFPLSLVKPTLPQSNPFILKFFSRLQRDLGSVLTKWQNCLAIVSIDRNILLYDSEDMTIPNQKVICQQQKIYLCLMKNQASLIFLISVYFIMLILLIQILIEFPKVIIYYKIYKRNYKILQKKQIKIQI